MSIQRLIELSREIELNNENKVDTTTEYIKDINAQPIIKKIPDHVANRILNSNGDPFSDTANIYRELKAIEDNYRKAQLNNSYIHDSVDTYENNPEEIDEDKNKALSENMNLSNILYNSELTLLSKEDSTSEINQFKTNIEETLNKTALTLTQNRDMCINVYTKVYESFKATDFVKTIKDVLVIRNAIVKNDIRYVSAVDHLIEAMSDRLGDSEEDITNNVLELLEHHKYLFSVMLNENKTSKQEFLNPSVLSNEKIQKLVELIKRYITVSKQYQISKIFAYKNAKDIACLYNNMAGSLEIYNNTITVLLNTINNIGNLEIYKGLSQEEKLAKDDELYNNTINNFIRNFIIPDFYSLSSKTPENVQITNIFHKQHIYAFQDNKLIKVNFENKFKNDLFKLNNDALNSICTGLDNINMIKTENITRYLNTVIDYLKNGLPSLENSENLVSVNIILKVLTELVDIYKDDIIYKYLNVPKMLLNHMVIYKEMIDVLKGEDDEDKTE